MAFLDTDGLTRLWYQIVNKVETANPGPVTATSTDGAAYTATVPGIDALTVGARFIMIPDKLSTSTTPTLNVNGLGAKGLRMRSVASTATGMAGYATGWLAANKPVEVMYNGVFWLASITRYGTSIDAASINNSSATYNPTISLGTSGIALATNNTETTTTASALWLNTDGTVKIRKSDTGVQCELSGYTSLYSNSSGTTGTITLSSSAANFKFLEIGFTDGTRYMTQRVYSPNGKAVALHRAVYGSSTYYDDSTVATISGTSLTQSNQGHSVAENATVNNVAAADAQLKIVEVLGWN